MNPGNIFFILIGIIIISISVGTYVENDAIGFMVFGGGVIALAIIDNMVDIIRHTTKD